MSRTKSNSTTRFVVLSPEKKWAKPGNGKVVTTFVFRVRNLPAALYKALGGFATNGVNMTKLESYMVGGNFFATQFYADVEGHPDDTALVHALEELAFFSKELHGPRRLSGAQIPRHLQGRERRRIRAFRAAPVLGHEPGIPPSPRWETCLPRHAVFGLEVFARVRDQLTVARMIDRLDARRSASSASRRGFRRA